MIKKNFKLEYMKNKNKTFAWIYTFTCVAGILNAYLAHKVGNIDATIAWLSATGLSMGALGAFLELIERDKNDDNGE
jgi:hypothetical protein